MKRKKKVQPNLFKDFPEHIFVTHGYDGDDGYFLLWENEKDAAENAHENDSEVATYSLSSHGRAVVDYQVSYIDEE